MMRYFGHLIFVVGDLVYCKEYTSKKEKETSNAESPNEDSNDTFDCHDLDKISVANLPKEKQWLGKGIFFFSLVLALFCSVFSYL